MASIRIKRGTRAQLDAAAAASSLKVGELYHITDEDRVELGTAATASVATAKKSEVDAKQATLVSGTNIKTVNGTSLLGAGDVSVEPTITKAAGYAKWTGAAWSFVNETYALSTHDHSGTYQPVDADLTAIAALAGTSGLLKKTAADTWTLDTGTYLTGNQSITFSGDASGSGTTAVTLTLATVPVAKGGTGATTLTGVLKGNGTSALTAATAGTDFVAPGTATTFSAPQLFPASGIRLKGSGSGYTTLASANASATNYTITLPAANDTVVTLAAAQALTGKTYNGVNPTANTTGFSVAGGTTSKTLTVSNSLTLAGTDSSTLNIGGGGTLGSAAYTAASAYEPAITTLSVGKGGTGAGSFTAGGLLVGTGTSPVGIASAAQIVAAIGATAVTNATNASNTGGYKMFGGGGTTNGSGNLTVTFPSAFSSTTNLGVVATGTNGINVVTTAVSTSSVTFQSQTATTGAAAASIGIRWVAVGPV